ncbi:ATP-binding protein [Fusobacterium sp. SYSU M8D902]|uniref:ATP-binding protein n=1 Tax=Fusobacterium sp. SYSU M8D902 TaxID=3159562 RepID=UPI0032E486FA
MKIIFENLGPVEKGEIELNKLNIFCGKNNEGKTYINYLIYTILTTINSLSFKRSKDFIKEFPKEKKEIKISLEEVLFKENYLKEILLNIEEKIIERLPIVFSVSKDFFKDFKIKFEYESIKLNRKAYTKKFFLVGNHYGIIEKDEVNIKVRFDEEFKNEIGEIFDLDFDILGNQSSEIEEINRIITDYIIVIIFNLKRVYSFPAERSGLAIFYNELLIRRNNILDSFIRENRDEKILKEIVSRYPKPINDYINFLNQIPKMMERRIKQDNKVVQLAKSIEKDLLYGEYKVKDHKKIIYTTKDGKELELYTSSSLVKTVIGIINYLKYYAVKGDYFLIDEPELNLHPENQRKIARIFARMINYGINIVMTTHSPYIINELNNLIMLNKVSDIDKERIMNNNGIVKNSIIKAKDISAYLVNNHKIEEMNKGEYGLEVESFNETIDNLNNLSDDIYSSIED